jgi:hypothetical protein
MVAGAALTLAHDGMAASTPGDLPLTNARVLSYPLHQVWPTAVRYLRVDRAYVLIDRDPDAGYILFEFPLGTSGEAKGRGSFEVFATKDASGRDSARVEVGTDSGPVHLPSSIVRGLADKLKSERGQPPPPPKPEPPPPETPPKAPDQEPPESEDQPLILYP